MGLFSKKKSEEKFIPRKMEEEIPQLPQLPKISEFDYEGSSRYKNNLPTFPRNNLGDQLSQNSIKEAVSGEKEEEDSWADEDQMMPLESLEDAPHPEYSNHRNDFNFQNLKHSEKKEPVFVRLDKFEEGLKIFEKLKEKTQEIEKLLKEIKKEKEKENKEIHNWEKELESMKNQIESLNKSIFSKIE